ncbi:MULTISPECIES: tellurium resistance protein TerW [Pectobacterium]|uniref:Tellurium resistance protein TerW n=1 Tax=Pectobacterium polonicum TaxID=2485124 RepID=A0ABV1PDC8_9GAMM|nr:MULTISPECIES: tellurium resistance protein TerW [Pectobacterium]GKW11926.1 tellurium resistance protein TerW [Pectobacterium carotovorum subsp. carotovorum]MBT9183681.1 tellurium resistance protein TerW [Pectobacterium punjabense]MDC9820059.1 tellurium resistance protein TerW [Pectobacterium polonicum]MDG0797317.1 tellurium resistance protein TerW [Pectobacterium punjabense]TKY83334.1 tellurium resistance protein TerW [Pectobacterium polonicum]
MQLSTRQVRVYRLAKILGAGKPVAAKQIITMLDCSEPTLTRVLKELRSAYSAEIKYSKSLHAYQMIHPGQLDKKELRRMAQALESNAELKEEETVSRVFLDKEKKKAVSLSLRMSVLRKIDTLAGLKDVTRSEAVEMLIGKCADELIRTSLPPRK